MPTYVVLFNWTEQGIKGYKQSASRVDAFSEQVANSGARLQQILWTVGPYDLIGILEADNGESLAAAMLELGAQGNVRTTTMRAFNADEFNALVARTG